MTTSIETIALEVDDVAGARPFYEALGVTDRVGLRQAETDSTGFRGFTLSLVVGQPGTVDEYLRVATGAGATVLKPARKSLWGYGAVVQAPDGTIWKFATQTKKHTGPGELRYDDLVLLLGVEDVKRTKDFYVDRGLDVAKSFGGKYVEFAVAPDGVQLSLYSRKAAAKDAGVAAEGSGSHRIAVLSDLGAFTDLDGFVWELATAERKG